MSIVSITSLSNSDLRRLGNNLRPRSIRKSRPRRKDRVLMAVNRSLAPFNERIDRFLPPAIAWSSGASSRAAWPRS